MLFLYRHMDQMVVWTIASKTLENLSEPSTSFPSPADSSSYSSIKRTQPCLQYKFHEIQLAINNFDETLVVGKGRSGKVYKGNVSNGSSLVVAAIKRMDSTYNQGADELWSEVEMLSTFRHCNIASLIGYCNQGEEMILVYEYIPNGSLYDHLHKLVTPLSWLQRLNICIHAGHGLHYLHTGIEVGVIHRDIKSSNVLLDESLTAKIADLGLAMIVPRKQTYIESDAIKGTFGYSDPDYCYTGKLTRKSDVYAFGVLFEVPTAEACLHGDLDQRPTMAEVLVSLESVLTLQEKFNNSLQPTSKPAREKIFDRIFGGKVRNFP
ncbi:receptor-like protein kinase FERONIA [Tanacetum coccineum]